jgi:hypothetical protein
VANVTVHVTLGRPCARLAAAQAIVVRAARGVAVGVGVGATGVAPGAAGESGDAVVKPVVAPTAIGTPGSRPTVRHE